MLPRTPLFMLLTASLLATPSFQRPQLPTLGSLSEGIHKNASFESQQFSTDDKYTLRGTVINSVTSEPIRGALVQIYFNGQSSMLTGPDGKFQFAGLPPGQSTIMVRKPGFFSEDDFDPHGRGQHPATTPPNSPALLLTLSPETVISTRIR